MDRILVVDDGSRDGTARVAFEVGDDRVRVVTHAVNQGVGAAIATGYAVALAEQADVTVVAAADGQMDPADMAPLVREVLDRGVDYAKGSRLRHVTGWFRTPLKRLAGTLALTLLTMPASGFFHILDTQCGYTAISHRALRRLRLDELYPRYGYPNDLLIRLARQGATVRDVPVRAVYGPGTSKMRVRHVILPVMGILWRGVAQRIRGV